MNCASNIITANFSGGKTHATTARVYQWSRGIELCITGADDLPQTFKAHFSVQKRGGVATTIVGIDERVDVPNVLFTIGKDIHVWLGASETEDDAEILYTVDIPVAPAPMPEYYDAEDTGVFDAVVEQVSGYAATATAAANSAGASASAAAGSASAAAASVSSAAGSAAAAEQAKDDAVTAKGQAETAAQTATQKAQQSAQSAEQAASDAGRAESAAQKAETAQTGAESAVLASEAAARDAAAGASAASASATSAGQAASAAAQSASAAAQSAASIEGDVQTATQKASEATTAAGQAVTAKDAAVTAQTAAETAATNAGQSASTATTKAAEAAQSASGAAQSKTDAEAAATRAEQAAASLTVDDSLSDTSENPVQNKVVTESVTQLKNALEDINGNNIIPWTVGAYINLNVATVDYEHPVTNAGWKYALVPCSEGDLFTVSCIGRLLPKPWSFIKSDGTKILTAIAISSSVDAVVTDQLLIAPTDAAYLVLNDNSFTGSAFYGEYLGKRVTGLEQDMSNLYERKRLALTYGYRVPTGYSSSGTYIDAETAPIVTDGVASIRTAVKKGDKVIITARSTSASYRTLLLVDSHNIVYASSNGDLDHQVYDVQDDGVLVVNNKISQKLLSDVILLRNLTQNKLDELTAELAAKSLTNDEKNIVEQSNHVFTNGYGTFQNVTWVKGGWKGVNSFRPDLYPYRASISTPITVDKDTHVCAAEGFQVYCSTLLPDETAISAGAFACRYVMPAGSTNYITIGRINEDTSESLTDDDVIEFSKALLIVSLRGTDYSLYRNTFTGLEMYETMAIIGDSYSAGAAGNNWGKCLGRIIGTEITVWAQSGINSNGWITRFMQSMLDAPAQDLYWLNLGINDGSTVVDNPAYLGSVADVDEETYPDIDTFPNTFWGNMGRIIRNIQTHAPNAKIVLEKTLFANPRNAQINIPTTATKTINDTIGEISTHYGLPCLDQLDDAFYWSAEYAASMSSNHPRKYAWVGMANANRRLFAKAVLDNPEYFY